MQAYISIRASLSSLTWNECDNSSSKWFAGLSRESSSELANSLASYPLRSTKMSTSTFDGKYENISIDKRVSPEKKQFVLRNVIYESHPFQ